MLKFISENLLWIHFYYTSNVQHILIVLFRWFVDWKANCRRSAVEYYSQDFFKKVCNVLVKFMHTFFFNRKVSVQVENQYGSSDTAITFHMIDNQSIAIYTFPMCLLTSLSVDVILLPRSAEILRKRKILSIQKSNDSYKDLNRSLTKDAKAMCPSYIYIYIYIYSYIYNKSKVGDCSRGRPEGALFNSSTLPSIHTLYCWMLCKEVSSTIFKVFVMTQPGIEPRVSWTISEQSTP